MEKGREGCVEGKEEANKNLNQDLIVVPSVTPPHYLQNSEDILGGTIDYSLAAVSATICQVPQATSHTCKHIKTLF